MRPVHLAPIVLVAATLSAAGSLASAGERLTNRALLASMPDSMEAVLVLQAEPLLREECALKRELQGFFGIVDESMPGMTRKDRDFISSDGENNLDRIVFAEVVARKPVRRLVAGSAFQPPQVIGAGSFSFVAVWITKETNEPIKQRLESGNGIIGEVTKTTEDGLDVYQSPVEFRWSPMRGATSVKKSIHIAFPNEHVTIIALSADDLKHISKSLKAKAKEIPPRWQRAAAKLDIESPVLVLRRFVQDKQRFRRFDFENPQNIEILNVPIHSYGVTYDGGANVSFKLRVITPEPEDAEGYYHGGTYRAGFVPGRWKWDKRTDQDGFTADVVFEEKEGRNHHSSLIVLSMLGIMMAI